MNTSCLLPLLLAVSPQLDGTPEPELLTLTYDWPRSGSVAVTESSLKRGTRAKSAYTLRWSPEEGGESVLMEFADFRLLQLNGMDAAAPRLAPMVRRMRPLLEAIPKMRISRAGELIEFVGLDEAIEAVLATVESDESFEELSRSMRSPETRQLVSAKAADRWNVWAASLIGVETFAGEVWEGAIEMPSALEELPVDAVRGFRCLERFEHRGADCVRIEIDTTFDPESMKAMMLEMFRRLGNPAPPEEAAELEVARVDHVEGVWEVATLRPHRVKTTSVITSGPREQREEHEYVFAWR